MIPGNLEVAGFTAEGDTRVVLISEASVDLEHVASELTTHQEIVDIPVVFGDE